jgi:hypothetical protein
MAAVVNMDYQGLWGRSLSGDSITESDGSGNVNVYVNGGGCGRLLAARSFWDCADPSRRRLRLRDVPAPVRMNRAVWRRGTPAPIIGS